MKGHEIFCWIGLITSTTIFFADLVMALYYAYFDGMVFDGTVAGAVAVGALAFMLLCYLVVYSFEDELTKMVASEGKKTRKEISELKKELK